MAWNRWNEAGINRELWIAERSDPDARWGEPRRATLLNFEDPNGYAVWGEPSFTDDGTLYYVRFDTSHPLWPAEVFRAPRNSDGSYGPPERVPVRF
jgi:hypothetical protein